MMQLMMNDPASQSYTERAPGVHHIIGLTIIFNPRLAPAISVLGPYESLAPWVKARFDCNAEADVSLLHEMLRRAHNAGGRYDKLLQSLWTPAAALQMRAPAAVGATINLERLLPQPAQNADAHLAATSAQVGCLRMW